MTHPRALLAVALLSAITVIDGDTVEQAGTRYRLAGLDAPEIQHAKCPAEREAGIRAAARLLELLTGPRSELVETGRNGGFGRRLGRLWVTGPGGELQDWAQIAVAEGHAVACTGRCRRKDHDWCATPKTGD